MLGTILTHPANPGFGGQALNESLVEASPLTGPGRSGRPLDIRIQFLEGLPTLARFHSDAAVSTPQLWDEACPRSNLDRLPSDLDLAV